MWGVELGTRLEPVHSNAAVSGYVHCGGSYACIGQLVSDALAVVIHVTLVRSK